MNTPEKPIVLGIMSGTSMDGIDLALCKFDSDQELELLAFESMAYPEAWRIQLTKVHSLSGSDLLLLADAYTRYTAELIADFLDEKGISPDYIGAHGHTVFHQPEKHFTYQMLNGALLSALTNITVVCDFRSKDVGLGGQGAPLVPIGDRLLFSTYAACINIGGFSNISYEENDIRVAYDLGPANLVLNTIANQVGKQYDDGGRISASGQLIPSLLDTLNALPYFNETPPKSLGREWLEEIFNPIIDGYSDASPADLGRTLSEHIAIQIARGLESVDRGGKALITGGGAHNDFLVQRIRTLAKCTIEIPNKDLVDAKEAIVFALLAKLRMEGKINTLASVTGATRDSVGGAVHFQF